MRKIEIALAGGLSTAFAASLCCIGPLLAVFAGIGGAGLAATFEPLRPYLLGASSLFFGLAARVVYRRPKAAVCGEGAHCAVPRGGHNRTLFWAGLAVAAIIAGFPWWSRVLV